MATWTGWSSFIGQELSVFQWLHLFSLSTTLNPFYRLHCTRMHPYIYFQYFQFIFNIFSIYFLHFQYFQYVTSPSPQPLTLLQVALHCTGLDASLNIFSIYFQHSFNIFSTFSIYFLSLSTTLNPFYRLHCTGMHPSI